MRVGLGFDVHSLVPNRPLVLGGVRIPYLYGLEGHSDADVLLHAICDALIGAIAEGDIGKHFPDTDPQYREVRSTLLLEKVMSKVREKGFNLINIDATIVAQKPKLLDFIPRMVNEIAQTLKIAPDRINIKATTTEGLGYTGRGEGMAAYAVVLVEEN